MATTRRTFLRPLVAMLVITLALVGGVVASVVWDDGEWTPKLGLDLEGGTQMILQPQVGQGQAVNQDQLSQAVDIMRARVDGQGVSEAEVSTLGNNVVVAVPGRMTQQQEEALRQSSQMRFRPVLAMLPAQEPQPQQGQPTAPATPAPSGSGTAPATPAPSGSGAATQAPRGTPTGSGTARATPSVTNGGGGMTAAPAAPAAPTGTASPAPTGSASPAPKGTASPAPRATASPAPSGAQAPAQPPVPTKEPTITEEQKRNPQQLVQWATSEQWLTPQWQQRAMTYDCANPPAYDPTRDDPNKPSVACDAEGQAKYLLGPSVLAGQELQDATSGPATNDQGVSSGGYQVQLDIADGEPTQRYAAISGAMVSMPEPRNQLAVVLDNEVVSAPRFQSAITGGQAQITGNFTADSAQQLANQLKFGALPMSFTVQSTEQVSPTIGGDQLQLGIIAGLIGLLLVIVYSLIQYRMLGFVTVASLLLVAVVTYLCLTLLGWGYNLRLTMAGVTGAIVAIGTTADSFIVYFERVRDEVREGRRVAAAVQTGWDRAKRTILISDGVNLLAAAILYVLASSNVRGFAFMLIITTILDILVTFLFTHPLLTWLSRTKFFGEGHPWSGFGATTLGAKVRYKGRGRVALGEQAPSGAEGGRA